MNHQGRSDSIAKSLLIAILLASVLGCASIGAPRELPEREKMLRLEEYTQQLLDKQVKKQWLLGMAMAMRLKDGTVIAKSSGYADPSGGTSYGLDTRTAIGSLTKTFTAVVALQLVEEQRLSLDQTVSSWFPELPNADRITIRMLMSHTSGMNEYFESPDVANNKDMEWTPMSLVLAADELGFVSEPGGSDGFYSNANYVLLGMIIERVTGNPWDQEVEARIIEPLELTSTVYAGDDSVLEDLAGGYTRNGKDYENLLGSVHHSLGYSAGALTSSVSDLSTYAFALFSGDLFRHEETLELMLQPVAFQDMGMRVGFGLGMGHMEIRGMVVKAHPGNIEGYQAFIGYDPDAGVSVVATTNLEEGDVMMPSLTALLNARKYW